MTFYAPSSAHVVLPTAQCTSSPGVYYASTTPSVTAFCQATQPSVSSSPLPFSWCGKYGTCFSRSTSVILGILLIACGCASIGGATMALIYYAELGYVGTGYWCGAMFVSTGGIAIAAGHHKTDSLIIATAVTSGLSVAFGITQLTVSAFALTYDLAHWQCPILRCTSSEMDDCLCYTWERGPVVSSSFTVGASSMAIIFGFSLFVFCLRIICCPSSQQVIPMTAQYLPIFPQQYQSEAMTNQKMIQIPLQVQVTPTTVSMQPSPKVQDCENTISRNLVQENL